MVSANLHRYLPKDYPVYFLEFSLPVSHRNRRRPLSRFPVPVVGFVGQSVNKPFRWSSGARFDSSVSSLSLAGLAGEFYRDAFPPASVVPLRVRRRAQALSVRVTVRTGDEPLPGADEKSPENYPSSLHLRDLSLNHCIRTAPDSHRKQDTDLRISELSCCLLYTSPSPRDGLLSRMPSSA